ncbi:MAG TPA: ABC transporter permease [Thermoanaerobaculia bacterium]|nr:ABC transporter permease [Thermoanaerobaculia bacterium]
MNATTTPVGNLSLPPKRNLPRIYALEAKYDMLRALRLPAFVIPLFAFPLFFYVLFGVAMKYEVGSFDISRYLLATYGAFGVMNVALFGFGVGVAAERGLGWMLFKRATPMPPLAHMAGKMVSALLFGAAIVVALFALGLTAGGVRMPLSTFASLAGVLVLGSLPFSAFGLAIGYWAGPNSAAPICNLISLPMAFGSGMWMPLFLLPPVVRQIAHYLPAYHYSQLALGVLHASNGEPAWRSAGFLLGFTLLSLLAAWVGYRRDEGKTYG